MDEIPVLVADLRTVGRALWAAYGSQVAQDLAQQYRNMEETPRQSNLTKALLQAHGRIEGYIAEGEDPEGESTEVNIEREADDELS